MSVQFTIPIVGNCPELGPDMIPYAIPYTGYVQGVYNAVDGSYWISWHDAGQLAVGNALYWTKGANDTNAGTDVGGVLRTTSGSMTMTADGSSFIILHGTPGAAVTAKLQAFGQANLSRSAVFENFSSLAACKTYANAFNYDTAGVPWMFGLVYDASTSTTSISVGNWQGSLASYLVKSGSVYSALRRQYIFGPNFVWCLHCTEGATTYDCQTTEGPYGCFCMVDFQIPRDPVAGGQSCTLYPVAGGSPCAGAVAMCGEDPP